MDEIEALRTVDKGFGGLEDEEARLRVLEWAIAKYGANLMPRRAASAAIVRSRENSAPDGDFGKLKAEGRELAGIALMTDSGQFQLTVRDPKAKSTNDAAVRLALVTIYAYCELTGESSASSRRIVKPVLDDWRAYTPNTRVSLARHQGIIRSGDALSLDQHAKREAEKYVREILDDAIEGRWQPSGIRNKRKGKRVKSDAK
jgi:hypothetical protein